MSRLVRGTWSTYRVQDDVLSKGGVGSIHRTDDPGLVYKSYFDPHKAPSKEHLEKLVDVGRDVLLRQGKKPGDTPESSVNWPVDIVIAAQGGLQGVVLPILPPELFNADHGNVRTLEFLVMKRARPPRATGRVALLIRMAEILAFVDAKGLVHGDVNGKNLAWTADPKTIMYLIDCDGMLPQSPRPTAGVQAMGWADPRVLDRLIPAHDHLSDRYALALAMYRGLLLTPGKLDVRTSEGKWPEPGKIPDTFPAELGTLLRRGLAALDGEKRPAPQEWADALVAAYVPNSAYATQKLAELDRMSGIDEVQPTPTPIPSIKFKDLPPLPPLPGRPPARSPGRAPVPPPPVRPPVPPPPVRPPVPPPPVQPPWAARQYQPSLPPQPGAQWPPRPHIPVPATYANMAGPPGRVARHALGGGIGFFIIGIFATALVPYVAIIYTCIGLFQMRYMKSGYPGVNCARGSLAGFGGLSLVVLLAELSANIHA